MEIKKSELKKALEIVKPGLASKEAIEQTTSFAFVDGFVVTYNDEICISHPIPDLKISGAIQASELYLFLSKVKGDEIKLEIKETEITLKSGRAKAGLILESEIKLPITEEIKKKGKWKALPENFNNQVKLAAGACGKDMSEPILTCVYVNKELIQASDSYKIAECKLKGEVPVKPFLLPATSAMQVIKLKPTKIATGKGWVHFMTEAETVISCRIFEDKFVDISKFLKVKGTSIVLPKELPEVLETASIFSKRDQILSESVHITINSKKLEVRSKTETGCWFKEAIPIKYEGKPISFSIPPYLLKDILKTTLKCVIGKERLRFKGEDWIYIAALTNQEEE